MDHFLIAFFLSISFFACKPEAVRKTDPKIELKSVDQIETKLLRGGRIWALDWSPDGKYIACGNRTGLIKIYDSQSLELVDILTGFATTVNGIHWSPDSRRLAASGFDPRIIIWDLENKSRIIIEKHERQVRSVQWSPKGSYLASTSHDGTIRIWNAEGQLVRTFTGANFGCVGLDWKDEDIIAASCWDNTIRTYSMSGADSLIIENGDHRGKAVLSVGWEPNGDKLATGDYGNPSDTAHVVKFWNPDGTLMKAMDDHTLEIRDLSWHPDGAFLATGGETIRMRDSDGNLLTVFESNTSPVWSLDWKPDGSQLASGHNDGQVRIWNVEGKEINRIPSHYSEITATEFNSDSTRLAVGFSNGELRYYNLEELTSATYKVHIRSIRKIIWSHDQSHLAIASNDGYGSIWKVGKKELVNSAMIPGHGQNMITISWSPDDELLATGSYESKIHLWDVNGSKKGSLETKEGRVNNIAWVNGNATVANIEDDDQSYGIAVEVNSKNQLLTLIPLMNNEFALFSQEGKIIKGDPADFVIFEEQESGIAKLGSYQ